MFFFLTGTSKIFLVLNVRILNHKTNILHCLWIWNRYFTLLIINHFTWNKYKFLLQKKKDKIFLRDYTLGNLIFWFLQYVQVIDWPLCTWPMMSYRTAKRRVPSSLKILPLFYLMLINLPQSKCIALKKGKSEFKI